MKILIALLILSLPAIAQSGGQLSLAGPVVNSSTGVPIAGALVTIARFVLGGDTIGPGPQTQEAPVSRIAFTDSGGSFRFSGLPEGVYSVVAQKPEFTADSETDLQSTGVKLTHSLENIVVKLSPLGV